MSSKNSLIYAFALYTEVIIDIFGIFGDFIKVNSSFSKTSIKVCKTEFCFPRTKLIRSWPFLPNHSSEVAPMFSFVIILQPSILASTANLQKLSNVDGKNTKDSLCDSWFKKV